jgi:crossover junction endodeoxyribonuclease RuvC
MFLGLDLSLSGSGVVAISDDYTVQRSALLHVPHFGVERLFHLENLFLKYLEEWERLLGVVEFCCVEGYAYQEKGKVFEIGEATGIFLLNIFKNGIPFIKAAPNQIKKYATGKGDKTATKSLMLLKVYKNFNEEFSDDNICDAYVASRIAHDYYLKYKKDTTLTELTTYQKDVLKALHKSYEEESIGHLL